MSRPAASPAVTGTDTATPLPAQAKGPSVARRRARKSRRLRHPLTWVAAAITALIVIWFTSGPGAAFGVLVVAIAATCAAAPSPTDRRRRPPRSQAADHDGLPQAPGPSPQPSQPAARRPASTTASPPSRQGKSSPPRPDTDRRPARRHPRLARHRTASGNE